MNLDRHLQTIVIACFSALTMPAEAALDDTFLTTYGGTYSADCTNDASAVANVSAESLVFTGNDIHVASSSADVAYAWFGNSPPEYFLMALLGDLPEERQAVWLVYQDHSGLFLIIDGDASYPDVKFYRCAGAPARPPAPVEAPRQYELHELSAPGLLLYPDARAAYYKALGPLIAEEWLKELDGPSSENIYVVVAGTEYLRAYCCKNHDCYENNTVLLYSARQALVYGLVYQDGTTTLIGDPPTEVATALRRLWQELFRSDSG